MDHHISVPNPRIGSARSVGHQKGKGAASLRTHSTLTTREAFLGHSGQRDSQPVGGFGSPPSHDDNDCLRRFQRVSDGALHQSGHCIERMYASSSGERGRSDRWMDRCGSGSGLISLPHIRQHTSHHGMKKMDTYIIHPHHSEGWMNIHSLLYHWVGEGESMNSVKKLQSWRSPSRTSPAKSWL